MAVQLLWPLIFFSFLFGQGFTNAKSLQEQRIINGQNAKAKQFPYQVYLEVFAGTNVVNSCSGVIISDRMILTAAHCVEIFFDSIDIYFGAVNRKNKIETGHQRFKIYRPSVLLHEHWYISRYYNDIALIKLPIQLHFNEYIQPAQLPDANESYENYTAVLSGWGLIHDCNAELVESNLLKYYEGHILSNGQCTMLVHRFMPGFLFPSSLMCLEPSNSISCCGDSGGPLVLKNENGTYVLTGLRSVGVDEECHVQNPDIFTRVSSYLDWIEKARDILLKRV